MEKFNIDYSTKIIPIPTKHENAIQLSKVQQFIKRMRWEALQFLRKLNNTVQENYEFKNRKCSPCAAKTKLSSDLKRMKGNDNLMIPARKYF